MNISRDSSGIFVRNITPAGRDSVDVVHPSGTVYFFQGCQPNALSILQDSMTHVSLQIPIDVSPSALLLHVITEYHRRLVQMAMESKVTL